MEPVHLLRPWLPDAGICVCQRFASFDFNVQEGQAVNSDIGSVMPFVVLVVPSSFGLKAKLMGADIGYLKLPTFAFVICIHSASCQLLLWLSSSPSSASQSAPKLFAFLSAAPLPACAQQSPHPMVGLHVFLVAACSGCFQKLRHLRPAHLVERHAAKRIGVWLCVHGKEGLQLLT